MDFDERVEAVMLENNLISWTATFLLMDFDERVEAVMLERTVRDFMQRFLPSIGGVHTPRADRHCLG
jgi:hypothetical protein